MVQIFQFIGRGGIFDGFTHLLGVVAHQYKQFDFSSNRQIEIDSGEEDSETIVAALVGAVSEFEELLPGMI
jgi:hypothetical protein